MCSGKASLLPACLGLTIWIFSFFGSLWCTTFKINRLSDSTAPSLGPDNYEFGLFYTRKFEVLGSSDGDLVFYKTCVAYPENIRDTTWKVAGTLQVVSWVIGAVLIIALFASQCVKFHRRTYIAIGLLFICVCSLFDGLMFLAFQSDLCKANPVLEALNALDEFEDECKLGGGSAFVIFSIIGYFVVGLICFCLKSDSAKEMAPATAALDTAEKEEPEVAAAAAAAEEEAKEEEAKEEAPVTAEAEEEAPAAAVEEEAAADDEAVPEVEETDEANESMEVTAADFSSSVKSPATEAEAVST